MMEQLTRDLKSFIETYLPDELARVSATYADDMPLPMPVVYRCNQDSTEVENRIVVLGRKRTPVDEHQMGGRDYRYAVELAVTAFDTDNDTADVRALRFDQALYGILAPEAADKWRDVLGYDLVVMDEDLYDNVADEGAEYYFKQTVMTIEITRREVTG